MLEKSWFDYHHIENHIVSFGFKDTADKRIGWGHVFLLYVMYYFEDAFAPCANIVKFDTLNELIGTAIAAYLVATNNSDKIDRLFVTFDWHLTIGDDTNRNYAETINDEDVYAKYMEDVDRGIKNSKFNSAKFLSKLVICLIYR